MKIKQFKIIQIWKQKLPFSGNINFNGDDAVELVNQNSSLDVIGEIGFDDEITSTRNVAVVGGCGDMA